MVNDTIVPDANAPALATMKFLAVGWTRILPELQQPLRYPGEHRIG
jgi:hypothetical protein